MSTKNFITNTLKGSQRIFNWLNKFIILVLNLDYKFKSYASKDWIKLEEFGPFLRRVIWCLGILNNQDQKALVELVNNITLLYEKSGSNFTFLYLKDVRHTVIRYLSGADITYKGKLHIKIDRTGIPRVIPAHLRHTLRRRTLVSDRKILLGILTILSMFRSFKTSPKVKLHTVIDPFGGVSDTLNRELLSKAIGFLKVPKYRRDTNLFPVLGLLNSSPNTKISIMGADLDAFAYLHNFRALKSLVIILMFERAYLLIVYFIILLVLFSPLYLLLFSISRLKFNLGSLSCVYDQAGKARIIGVTNWWTQVALKPLHNFIFKWLETIPMDGTKNQEGSFDSLIKRVSSGQKLYGFDLSAATDRLPRNLQKDILEIIGYKSVCWDTLMSVPFYFRKREYSYAVGQPMGAYSSWAMLAMTHHIIVQVAAYKATGKNFLFYDYCVLGDDIVIANDAVAEKYLEIMTLLDVGISSYKSINSDNFTEFAKTLKGRGINLTPISSGLILKTLRHNYYLSVFFWDLLKKGIHNLRSLSLLLDGSGKYLRRHRTFFLWVIISQLFLELEGKCNGKSLDYYQSIILDSLRKEFREYWQLPDHLRGLVEKSLLSEFRSSLYDLASYNPFLICVKNKNYVILNVLVRIFSVSHFWFFTNWIWSYYRLWQRYCDFINFNYPSVSSFSVTVVEPKNSVLARWILIPLGLKKREIPYPDVSRSYYLRNCEFMDSFSFPNIDLNNKVKVKLAHETMYKLWKKNKKEIERNLISNHYKSYHLY